MCAVRDDFVMSEMMRCDARILDAWIWRSGSAFVTCHMWVRFYSWRWEEGRKEHDAEEETSDREKRERVGGGDGSGSGCTRVSGGGFVDVEGFWVGEAISDSEDCAVVLCCHYFFFGN